MNPDFNMNGLNGGNVMKQIHRVVIGVVVIIMFMGFMAPVGTLNAAKLTTLKEITRPDLMALGNDRLYISEKTTIYIYSMKDFKLIKAFGKAGEGPQEFSVVPFGAPMIYTPYENKIYVSHNARVSIFTKDGDYIEEFRVPPFSVFVPFLKNYVANGTSANEKNEQLLAVNLYDSKINKLKELYLSDMKVGPSGSFNFPFTSFVYVPYKDKVYVVIGKEGFCIDVFDNQGKKLYRIKKPYNELKLPEEYKTNTLNWFKTAPNYKQYFDFFKERISFKEKYPAIQYIAVKDDRIYVVTYAKKNENTECIILDLKGKELKRIFVPLPIYYGIEFYTRNDFDNKTFYYIMENEEDESWELHSIDLK